MFRSVPANWVNSAGELLVSLTCSNLLVFLFISLLISLIVMTLFVLFSQLRSLYKRLRSRQLAVFKLIMIIHFAFKLIMIIHFAFNRLTPNDPYMGRTAPLSSKHCILYIYSTNIGTEYFKHALYSSFFPLQNAVCFLMLTCLVPVLFTFYIQVC